MQTQSKILKTLSLLLITAAAFFLNGCGDGSTGATGAPGGTPAAGGAGGVAGAAGTVNAAALTPAAFSALAPGIDPASVSVSINSPPVVKFKVTDGNGNPLVGLFATTKNTSAGATVASYSNIQFALAKLVPGTNGSPSKWVSYIVTNAPTSTSNQTLAAGKPSTDNTGTLVDNGDGTYTYTFYRDITKASSVVPGLTFTGNNKAADVGDLTYTSTLTHRLGIIISGTVPGTGTNTSDASTSTTSPTAVLMQNPINFIYDFIPATGKAVTATDFQRVIVDKASCNNCHAKLGGIPGTDSQSFHNGARYDPKLCDVCHTDQRKYGNANVASAAAPVGTAPAFPAITKDASGNVTSAGTYVADGVTVGDFPVLIHRIHKGELLVKQNYNFGGVLLNETRFPQDIRNCTSCHDNTKAAQADNWKNVPSRLACGACHDGINWADGTGYTNADAIGSYATKTGHAGGAQADDSKCSTCHTPADIATAMIPVTPPNTLNTLQNSNAATANNNTNAAWIVSNASNLPAGAIKVTWDLKTVTVDATGHPMMVFRFLQGGNRVDFNPTTSPEIWNNFMGSPSLYWVFSVPQDGILVPADYNASISVYVRSLWNQVYSSATPTADKKGTLTGPDSSGYYTATMTGVTIPNFASANTILTGGIGYSYGVTSTLPLTQTNVPGLTKTAGVNATTGYPVVAATNTAALVAGMPNKTGGLIVIAPDTQKVALMSDGKTSYAARRPIVQDTLCNKCHIELGPFTLDAFHAGQRNDGSTCSWCHNPQQSNSGWSGDSTYFIHAIHAAGKRSVKFTWHATAGTGTTATDGFFKIAYPGILSACQTCHLPGTYDFSASASAAQVANRLYRTTATGTTAAATYSTSPYIAQTAGTAYGSGFSYSSATQAITLPAATTLVNSPIAAACFACHETAAAISHMEGNGGSINDARGQPATNYTATGTGTATSGATGALAKAEQCSVCHFTGKVADIATVHPAAPVVK